MQVSGASVNFDGLNTKKCMLFAEKLKSSENIKNLSKNYNIVAYEKHASAPMNGYVFDLVMDVSEKVKGLGKLFKKPQKTSIIIESVDSIRNRDIEREINKINLKDIEKGLKEKAVIKKIINGKNEVLEQLKLGRDMIGAGVYKIPKEEDDFVKRIIERLKYNY